MNQKNYRVLGMMSGTSLDGLDLALIDFWQEGDTWKYSLLEAETIVYDESWREKLLCAPTLSGEKLISLHAEYGRFLGRQASAFLTQNKIGVDLIASHGHTVFHAPQESFTFQLGDGASIASEAKLTTISDFRTQDVSLSGQGAPLVPFGDRELFGEFDACINLGGICNISLDQKGRRLGYDIVPCNILLNSIAQRVNKAFDEDGDIGREGNLLESVLEQLDSWTYFEEEGPKSLHKEDVELHYRSFLEAEESINDLMNTAVQHIVNQVAKSLQQFNFNQNKRVLLTGGGALNKFLVEGLSQKCVSSMIIPEKGLIEYKEALIFAFLALMRFQNKINVLASVTGAQKDHSAGQIYRP